MQILGSSVQHVRKVRVYLEIDVCSLNEEYEHSFF